MATTTFYPSSYGTVLSKGTFTSPTNAYADNTTYAELASLDRNDINSVYYAGFDFSSISAGSTINSVTVEAQYHYSTTGVTDFLTLQARKSATPVGTASNNTSEPTTDYIHQNSNTGSWTQAELSTLDVYITWDRPNVTTAATIYFDYISVTVDYTASQNYTKTVTGNTSAQSNNKRSSGKGITAQSVLSNSIGRSVAVLKTGAANVLSLIGRNATKTISVATNVLSSFQDAFTGYTLERKDGVAGEWFLLARLTSGVSEYNDSYNLSDGVTYYYRIKKNVIGLSDSEWSNIESYTYTAGETVNYKTVSSGITISMAFVRDVDKNAMQIIGVSADTARSTSTTKIAGTSILSTSLRQISKAISTVAAITVAFLVSVSKNISVSSIVTSAVGRQISKAISSAVTMTVTVIDTVFKVVNGSVTILRNTTRLIARLILSTANTSASLYRSSLKTITSLSTVAVSGSRAISKRLQKIVTTTGNTAKSIVKSIIANIAATAVKIASYLNPVPTITSVSATRISDELTKDSSYVEFQTNEDIDEWEVRATTEAQTPAVGVGLLVGSGGSAVKDSTLNFTVDDEELTAGDRTYTITIYVRIGGTWYG